MIGINAPKPEDKKHFRVGCIALIVIAIAIIAFTAFSGNDDAGNKEPSCFDAYVMSQVFVERQLKAPSSADFPAFDNSMVIPLGNGRFKVTAYVDAQNSFGAMIRTPYTCTIKKSEGDNWLLEDMNLGN